MLEREDVLKLAKLSRLSVSEEEIPGLVKHLDGMLAHMESLRSLDLSAVEPMTGIEDGVMELREDVPVQGLSSEEAFRNAPEMEAEHFVIPKVIGS